MTKLTDDELLAWLERNAHGFSKGEEYQLYKSHCAQAAARFRELLALQEWQPIEDAPINDTVLTQHKEDLFPVPAYRLEGYGVWLRETEGPEDDFYGAGRHQPLYRQPTHFRPLPDPPKDG